MSERFSPEIEILEERLAKTTPFNPYKPVSNIRREERYEDLAISVVDMLKISSNYSEEKFGMGAIYIFTGNQVPGLDYEDDRESGSHYFIFSPEKKRLAERFVLRTDRDVPDEDLIPLENLEVIVGAKREARKLIKKIEEAELPQEERRREKRFSILRNTGYTILTLGVVGIAYTFITDSLLIGITSIATVKGGELLSRIRKGMKPEIPDETLVGYDAVRVIGEELIKNKEYEIS